MFWVVHKLYIINRSRDSTDSESVDRSRVSPKKSALVCESYDNLNRSPDPESTILALDQSTDSKSIDRSRVKTVVFGSVDRLGVSRISGSVTTYKLKV
uniref:Uncharacterized protein n=1 Tax=Acrobeloides nanus TaxID=290746 RepID=A0A914C0G9_9BILA